MKSQVMVRGAALALRVGYCRKRGVERGGIRASYAMARSTCARLRFIAMHINNSWSWFLSQPR